MRNRFIRKWSGNRSFNGAAKRQAQALWGDIRLTVRQIIHLVTILALIFLFWNYPVLYPLKLMVVFFHESSHALAAVLSGGRVTEMVVIAQQGGHVLSIGGNRFITLSAGYLGSLIWGVLIYLSAALTRWDRGVMFVLGLFIAIITLVFVSNAFAIIFGLTTAVLMVLAARFLPRHINDFLLRLIGLTSMMYVVLDIYNDTIVHAHLRSDARMLAEEFGGVTALWGWSWIALSVLAMAACFRWTAKINPLVSTSA